MLNDTAIIFHGPMNLPYTIDVMKSFLVYNHVADLVVSCWDDTPTSVLEFLQDNKIKYIVNPYPAYRGLSTLNWQRMGFLYGVYALDLSQYKYVFKTRYDMVIYNLDKLLLHLKDKIENKNGKPVQLMCWDNLCNGPCDYHCFFTIEEAVTYWSFPNCDVISERYVLPQYFAKKGIPYDFTYQSMLQLCDTWVQQAEELGIMINRFKYTDESPLNLHFENRAIYL